MISISWKSMKGSKCFVDTSALIALNHARDQHHQDAQILAAALKDCELIISDAVVTETYTLLRYRLGFHPAHFFLQTVMKPSFTLAEVTPSIRMRTLEILKQYNDHAITYCDALSVALMETMKIDTIFSFDYHFEVMGVELLRV